MGTIEVVQGFVHFVSPQGHSRSMLPTTINDQCCTSAGITIKVSSSSSLWQTQDESTASSFTERSSSPIYMHHTALRTRNITTAIEFYSLLGFQVYSKFRAGPARAAWLYLPTTTATTTAAADSSTNNTTSTTTTMTPTPTTAKLELIEIPSYILQEPQGMRRRAIDLIQNTQELGFHHMALDVTAQIQQQTLAKDDGVDHGNHVSNNLSDWLEQLNQQSVQRFGRTLRVAVPPRQQMMGQAAEGGSSVVYEIAFMYDADGALIELLHHQSKSGGSFTSSSLSLTQTTQSDNKNPNNIASGWDPWDGQGFQGKT
jgi:catechol 2,3-dioxygenase-like lactoylglutathione lyase family enzyme